MRFLRFVWFMWFDEYPYLSALVYEIILETFYTKRKKVTNSLTTLYISHRIKIVFKLSINE